MTVSCFETSVSVYPVTQRRPRMHFSATPVWRPRNSQEVKLLSFGRLKWCYSHQLIYVSYRSRHCLRFCLWLRHSCHLYGGEAAFRIADPEIMPCVMNTDLLSWPLGRLRLKCDGTRAETRFRLSAKRTSPFKSAGASGQSTTGSRGVRISGSNAGYTMFRGSVKSTGYPLHSPVSPSLTLPCVTVCHHISTGLYQFASSPPIHQAESSLGSAIWTCLTLSDVHPQ